MPKSNLRILHGQPVWSIEYGWLIIDSINECMIAPNGITLPFESEINIYYKSNEFTEGVEAKTQSLYISEIKKCKKIWLEPISSDINLRQELRGWYTVMSYWVENSVGNRFLFDTYNAKWIAFREI